MRAVSRLALLVSLGTLGLLVLAIEGGLRIFGYHPLAALEQGRGRILRASSHPDLAYDLSPSTQAFFRGSDVRVNSFGFRGREIERRKPAGVRRLIVIGDSIAFGDGLAAEDVFANRLEELARARGEALEVLNLGVGGYDVLEAVAFLEHVGLDLQPDIVVLGFCINDVGVQSFNLPFVEALKGYGAWTRRSRLLQLLTVRIDTAKAGREYAALNREDVFRRRNAEWIAPLGADDGIRADMERMKSLLAESPVSFPYLEWYTSEARIGKLRYSFERLARDAREAGFEAVVVVIPYLNEKGHPAGFRLAYEMVRSEAERAGLRTVDVLEDFLGAGLEELSRYPGGVLDPLHPNPEGHALIAARLHAELLEER